MKKYFLIAVIFCIIGLSSCYTGPYYEPIEMNLKYQNYILGKWLLIGKSYPNHAFVDVSKEGKYIEFMKNDNNVYGNYASNFYPEGAYYIITDNIIRYYYSLDSLNKSPYLYDYYFMHNIYELLPDTLRLVGFDWFADSSIYTHYYFIKMED